MNINTNTTQIKQYIIKYFKHKCQDKMELKKYQHKL